MTFISGRRHSALRVRYAQSVTFERAMPVHAAMASAGIGYYSQRQRKSMSGERFPAARPSTGSGRPEHRRGTERPPERGDPASPWLGRLSLGKRKRARTLNDGTVASITQGPAKAGHYGGFRLFLRRARRDRRRASRIARPRGHAQARSRTRASRRTAYAGSPRTLAAVPLACS